MREGVLLTIVLAFVSSIVFVIIFTLAILFIDANLDYDKLEEDITCGYFQICKGEKNENH